MSTPLGRRTLAGLVLGSLAFPFLSVSADADAGKDDRPDRASHRLTGLLATDARGSTATRDGSGFLGSDGLFYAWAPLVVSGINGEVFYGPEFDTACADGQRFAKGLKRLAKLARMIERTGRRVVYTVAPNKSSVNSSNLDTAVMPHGVCSRMGMSQQDEVLDGVSDPNFLRLRSKLSGSSREVYWKTDAHWTTVGSSLYAHRLATKLAPRLGDKQRYQYTTRTELGDLYELIGINQPESAEAAIPTNGVTVTTVPGSDGFDPVNAVTFDHSWLARPHKKTWRGQTLVIGDSFTYLGLESIRPLFRSGRFLWIQPQVLDTIKNAIPKADTVVIEVVQRFVSTSILATTEFRKAVRRELRQADH